jgi:hypothetical protein
MSLILPQRLHIAVKQFSDGDRSALLLVQGFYRIICIGIPTSLKLIFLNQQLQLVPINNDGVLCHRSILSGLVNDLVSSQRVFRCYVRIVFPQWWEYRLFKSARLFWIQCKWLHRIGWQWPTSVHLSKLRKRRGMLGFKQTLVLRSPSIMDLGWALTLIRSIPTVTPYVPFGLPLRGVQTSLKRGKRTRR